ncbi:MAG: ADP-ribose pyrophosphatase [Ignavibacteria bacterium RBG_13_36_8]|nr:MAG: ADP-ribose pyrophosphatase [Ignavibacteria bacterium RBG_13_36_8]
MNYRVKKENVIFRGHVFDVKVDEIEYNSGNKSKRETVVHPGGAVIVAVKDDGKIILVKQYRHALQKFIYELPAGKLGKHEDPLHCAARELAEETGYTSDNITKLGYIYTTPGYCDEILHIYLAKNLKSGNHNREEGEENMELHEFILNEIDEMIRNEEIVDGKTLSGIYLYKNLNL